MKRQFMPFFALLIGTTTLISCNNDNSAKTSKATTTDGKASDNPKSAQALQGRYVNTASGIRSFTFKKDGSFERAAAASGYAGGTDYVASNHNAGNYQINGDNISLTYADGTKETLPVEIFPSSEKDAKPETPFRISIDNVIYTNVSE